MTHKGTVIEVLEETASAYPDRAALRHKQSDGWATLTPTLKLKRRVIQEVFGTTIDELYEAPPWNSAFGSAGVPPA